MKLIKYTFGSLFILLIFIGSASSSEMLFYETINDKLTYRYTVKNQSLVSGFSYEESLPGNTEFGLYFKTVSYTHSLKNIDPPLLPDGSIIDARLKLYFKNEENMTLDFSIDELQFNTDNYHVFIIQPNKDSIIVEQKALHDGAFEVKISNISSKHKLAASSFELKYHPARSKDISNKSQTLAKHYRLKSNYPNPFNPITTIEYNLSSEAKVDITVYNMVGQAVKKLICKTIPAGTHTVEWNGKDEFGNNVSTGIYFYKIVTEGYSETRKMILLK
ncbi:T9SS type A sorting domain-containing protein [Candidatus Zixiibacteriota bacterium]